MAHWIIETRGFAGSVYKCSECGKQHNDLYTPGIDNWYRCPDCMANLDEPNEYVDFTDRLKTNNKEMKEEKKMPNKTKQELLNEIEEKNKEIKELKQQVEQVEKYKAYKDMACEMKMAMDAYVESGFTEDQAFELVQRMLEGAMSVAMKNMR